MPGIVLGVCAYLALAIMVLCTNTLFWNRYYATNPGAQQADDEAQKLYIKEYAKETINEDAAH